MLKRIGAEEGGEFKAVASGTLPSGRPVIVNADGTVSVISSTSASESVGTGTIFETGASAYHSCSYDTVENKTLIVWSDGSSSYEGQAAVATVSGTSISFGSVVTWASGNRPKYMDSVYDVASGKHVIVYEDDNNNDYGTAVVATVSGTSVSFGTPVVFDSQSVEYCSICYDSTAQKVVIAYRDFGTSIEGRAVVGTVSGTSISFGSTNAFTSATADYFSAVYDSANNKTVIFYRDGNNSDYGTGRVFTVSGTSISFGSGFVFNSGNSKFISASYDSSVGKILVVYSDASDSDKGKGIVATVSGTDLTFGSAAIFNGGQSTYMDAIYHPLAEKVFVSYTKNTSSDHKIILPATISGTSVTFGSEVTLLSDQTIYGKAAYDSTSKVLVVVYRGTSNDRGYASVYQAAYTETNITSENYIGMSRGVVDVVQTSGTEAVGTEVQFDAGNLSLSGSSSTFDSTNEKIVIVYSDIANSYYGTAIVGTVNGSSITFGTEVVFASVTTLDASVCFDSVNSKVVIAYKNNSDTDKPGTAIVGTVSGNSISFGTAVEFDAARSDTPFALYDSTNSKIIIAYESQNATAKAIVGTVSGTSISFGTASQFNASATTAISGEHDTSSGKTIITYSDSGNSARGTCVVATVSGTGISFGSEVVFETGGVARNTTGTVYDSENNRIVVSYSDQGDSDNAKAIVGTVSGTSISFGTTVTWQTGATQYNNAVYHSDAKKVIVFAEDENDSGKVKYAVGTVSGTSISFTTAADFTSSGTTSIAPTYDISNRIAVAAYKKDSDSSGNAATLQVTYTNTTITRGQVTNGQAASMDIIGSVSDNQISLTTGQQYFVQTDGTIGTTAATPSVLAGTAISATELVVKT